MLQKINDNIFDAKRANIISFENVNVKNIAGDYMRLNAMIHVTC